MNLNVRDNINFGDKQSILNKLEFVSSMTKRCEDFNNNKLLKENVPFIEKSIRYYLGEIAADSDFNKSVIESFSSEELRTISKNLMEFKDGTVTLNPLSRFKKYLTDFFTNNESDTIVLNDKKEAADALINLFA